MGAPYRERPLKAASSTSFAPLASEGSKEKQEHKEKIATRFHMDHDLMHEKLPENPSLWCQGKLSL